MPREALKNKFSLQLFAGKKKPDFSKPDTFTAEIQLKAEDINVEKRQITVSATSETMATRWYGYMLLGHRKEEVKLDRAKSVGSFLFAHGRDPQYGVVPPGPLVDIWLDEAAKKTYATLQFDEDEKADLLFKKVQNGSLKGISVGFRIKKAVEIGPDEEERGFKGSFYLVTEWEITEVSLEPTPELIVGVGLSADGSENESVLGEMPTEILTQEVKSMKFKVIRNGVSVEVTESELTVEERIQFGLDTAPHQQPAASAPAPAPAGNTFKAEDVTAQERKRTTEILTMGQKFGIAVDELNGYVEGGLSVAEVQGKILEKLASERAPVTTATITKDESEKLAAAMTDGLALKAGVRIEKPAPGAENFRGVRLMSLAQECAERKTGKSFKFASDEDILKAAFGFGEHGQFMGTSDLPNILKDVANKSVSAAYQIAETTYQYWTKRSSLSDFKAANRVTMSAADDLKEIKENGEFVSSEVTDLGRTIKLGTYGRKWGLTRKAIINDDLSALNDLPTKYAVAARRLINATVYGIITANPTIDNAALFHANHSNLANPAAALSVASLGVAKAAMRKQKDISGKQTLAIQPAFLLTPEALNVTAEQLIASTVDPSKNNAVPNPEFVRRLTNISEPLLDDNSTTAWYLAGAPGLTDTIEVAFLNGRDMPTIESKVEFDILGIAWRIFIDFGVGLMDFRALYKNAG